MSTEPIDAEVITPEEDAAAKAAPTPPPENRDEIRLPCGCWRGVRRREAPAFDPETGAAIMENGGFKMVVTEDLETVYCEEHAVAQREQHLKVQAALASGVPAEDAARILERPVDPFGILDAGMAKQAALALGAGKHEDE